MSFKRSEILPRQGEVSRAGVTGCLLLLAGFALAALPAAAAPPANPYNDRLLRLDRVNQLAVMRQAIVNGEGRCAHVVGAAYRGPFRNLHRWDAACDRGGNYAVFVGPDGTAQVRACTDLQTLRLPLCRPVPIQR
jgi:hypothetical protein